MRQFFSLSQRRRPSSPHRGRRGRRPSRRLRPRRRLLRLRRRRLWACARPTRSPATACARRLPPRTAQSRGGSAPGNFSRLGRSRLWFLGPSALTTRSSGASAGSVPRCTAEAAAGDHSQIPGCCACVLITTGGLRGRAHSTTVRTPLLRSIVPPCHSSSLQAVRFLEQRAGVQRRRWWHEMLVCVVPRNRTNDHQDQTGLLQLSALRCGQQENRSRHALAFLLVRAFANAAASSSLGISHC